VFSNEQEVLSRTVGGLTIEFHLAPGYTPDQLLVHFRGLSLLHCSDVYYYSLANIYTIRGERTRDALQWSKDVLKAASIPEVTYVVPTHALALTGRDEIETVLTNYADSIRYIHDQAVRQLMKGLTADVICTKMQLPESLKFGYTQEIYGVVETACKAVVDFYVGWFSGETEDLLPLSSEQLRDRLRKLVPDGKLLSEATKAYNDGDYRWALTLSTTVWKADISNREAKELRSLSQIRIAESQFSVNLRNYYLTMTLEDWGLLPLQISTLNSYKTLPLDSVCANLAAHVNDEKANTLTERLVIYIKLDTGSWKLELRNSILDCGEFTGTAPEGATVWNLTEVEYRTFLSQKVYAGYGASEEQVQAFFDYIDFVDEVQSA